MSRPRIVLVSRELFPFGGGGIGTYVAQQARALAPLADVTILTASWHRDKYHELVALGDPRVDFGGADVAFVEVPHLHEIGWFCSIFHLWSHRVVERMRELFADRPPDLVEFPDYLGEGFVATQARRGGDRFLANTVVAVRLHTSAEICEVLNGHVDPAFEGRVSRDLERRTLRDADVLLHAGGDILESYRRFYEGPLAPAARIRHALGPAPGPGERCAPREGPLRMLYVGRCERRKGVQDLLSAATAITADWRLTLLGRDTLSAPLGRSMRRTLELQAAGDPRITFREDIARGELPASMAAHDVVVLPSRWECWPYVALEAMAAGVPVVATPVGGFTELVVPGVSGWLTAAVGPDALIQTLGPLIGEPDRARALRGGGTIAEHALALSDEDAIRADYRRLLDAGPAPVVSARAPSTADPPPLVSIVIPYYRMHRFVAETVASAFAQTHPRIEVLVIDDGSFEPQDVVLAELATRYPLRVLAQANGGLGAARNFAIGQARGRYVLPLDADNVLEPTFVARCVQLLESDEQLAYVTSWNRYVDERGSPYPPPHEGYRPIGNWASTVEERNVAGDGTAVLRRSVFDRFRYSEDLTAFEDWALYRALARAGSYGRVIPEMLWRYRVREDSMLREVGVPEEGRLHAEMDAVIREQEVLWASTNG